MSSQEIKVTINGVLILRDDDVLDRFVLPGLNAVIQYDLSQGRWPFVVYPFFYYEEIYGSMMQKYIPLCALPVSIWFGENEVVVDYA